MADQVWRWNGSTWIEYTGPGTGTGFHTHTIEQVAGLQAALDVLTAAIGTGTGTVGAISDVPGLVDALAAVTERIAFLESIGANVVAIAGASSARVNQWNGNTLNAEAVALWGTDGQPPVNGLNTDYTLTKVVL